MRKEVFRKEAPIKNESVYAPFNPEEELEKIRQFTSEEQKLNPKEKLDLEKERLENFKNELIRQRKDIVELQLGLEREIRRNPDKSTEELFALVKGKQAELRLNDEQVFRFTKNLKNYENVHKALQKFREKYPDNKKLFKKLFSRLPKGKIEIWESPVTFHIRCFDIKDYALASFGSDSPENISEAYKERGKTKWFGKFNITLENTSESQNQSSEDSVDLESHLTFLHEEEHIIQRLIEDEDEDPKFPHGIYNLGRFSTKDQIGAAIKEYLNYKRRDAEFYARREILAGLKNNPIEELKEVILIDYPELSDIAILEALKEVPELLKDKLKDSYPAIISQDEIKKMVLDVVGEKYIQDVGRAVKSIKTLIDNGYSQDEITTLFRTEPLENWPKWAERLTIKI